MRTNRAGKERVTGGGAGRVAVGGLVLLFLSAIPVEAHKVSSVSLISHLDSEKGTYLLDAAMEVIPSEDDQLNEQIPPEAAAREFAEEYLKTMFDEVEMTPELEISIETASDDNTPEELQRQQVLVQMTGRIPEGAGEFLLYLEPTCPMAVVMVVIKDNKPSRRMQVILPGEFSRPVNVLPVVAGDPFVATGTGTEEGEAEAEAEPSGGTAIDPAEDPVGASSAAAAPDLSAEAGPGDTGESGTAAAATGGWSVLASGWRAFWGGSLLPFALVIAGFLMTTAKRPVFLQFAALIIGMSLAITLAAWKILPVPSPAPALTALLLIALSGECLFRHRFQAWRYPAFFGGGLGAGWLVAAFAFPRLPQFSEGDFSVAALIFFVFGAELALVAAGVAAAAFFLTMSRFDWYRKTVVTPVAVVLVAYGIFLLAEPIL